MVKNIGRKFGVIIIAAVCTPFLACNFFNVQPLAGTTNSDDPAANLAVFVDPVSDFSTRDVRDVDEEIVRFDPVAKTIIWAADGTAFQEGIWEVNGVLLASGGFQVRFGTKDGERRAYFTETANGFICQIEAQGGSISISGTNVPVPQE